MFGDTVDPFSGSQQVGEARVEVEVQLDRLSVPVVRVRTIELEAKLHVAAKIAVDAELELLKGEVAKRRQQNVETRLSLGQPVDGRTRSVANLSAGLRPKRTTRNAHVLVGDRHRQSSADAALAIESVEPDPGQEVA